MSENVTETPDHNPPTALPYAIAAPRPASKVWAGVALLFGRLCLTVLGGCFLIGVLAVVRPDYIGPMSGQPATAPLTPPQVTLVVALYAMALASFVGATAMLYYGGRGLIRIMRA